LISIHRKDFDQSLDYLNKSLSIFNEIGMLEANPAVIMNLGIVHYEKNQYNVAIPCLIYAHHLFSNLGSPYTKHIDEHIRVIIERIGEAKYQEILSQMGKTEGE
jgi:hypothetical protein